MRTNLFSIFAILMATVFFASCNEESTFGGDIAEVVATPKAWEPISDFYTSEGGAYINVNIIFDDEDVIKQARHQVILQTEDTITAVGEYPFFCKEDLAEGKEAKASMQYSYCYNKTNTIKVNGLIMSYEYNGKTYSLPCASTITVAGRMTEAAETEAGFTNTTVYTVIANSKKLAEGIQAFLAVKPNEPEPKPEAQPTGWKQDGDKAEIIFDDGTTVTVPNTLTMTAEKRYEVEGTVAATCNNLTVDAKDSNIFAYNHGINNTVKVNGNMGTMDYKEWKNIPCLSKFTIGGVISADETSNSGYEFWWLGHTEYTLYADGKAITTATQEFLVSKARTLVSEDITFEHGVYRTPSYSNDIITIICDNVMNVLQKYSDNTSEETKVDYAVSNLYDIAIPVFVLNSKDALVGVSANFANGIAEVLGKNITISHRSNNVSDIIFNGKNYRDDSRRPNCEPKAEIIYFKSENKADVTFDNGQTVEVDYTVKVAINFDGVLVKGWATDSYVDGVSGVASREGTYFHFVVLNNGAYTMYSAKVRDNMSVTDFTATSVSEAFVSKLSNDNPAAYTGKSVAVYTIGYIDNVEKYKENSYIIDYMLQNGTLDRTVGFTGGAIKEGYRYPIRGTWSENIIAVEGTTYYITGSQN